MIKVFLLLILLLGIQSKCFCYQFYSYHIDKINVPNSMFVRYINPQIRSIMQGYYHALKKLHPMNEELISSKNVILSFFIDWNRWKKECTVITIECKESLNKIHKMSKTIENKMLKIQNSIHTQFKKQDPFEFDSIIQITNQLDKISNLNYKILHVIENIQIISQDVDMSYNLKNESISTSINEMKIISERIITELLPRKIKLVYLNFWNFFIKHLEEFIIYKRKKTFFLQKLGELNFAWNNFSMKISKQIIVLPQNISNQTIIMHHRWNSILKIIFKNHK